MKTRLYFLLLVGALLLWNGCEKEIRNIAGTSNPNPTPTSAVVHPQDINEQGFEFLEKMQGHWVGAMRIIADDLDWFAFDYRAISPSQIHGIFEGGSGGNLFTDFFVTDFKGTRTIMARNGGLLNSIYRTSYFVMDSVSYTSEGDFYRLIDAEGGTNTMWMELRFTGDSLYFNAYTSRLGLNSIPTRHMTFQAKKEHLELATTAAANVNFPQNTPAWDFSNGFNQDHLYAEPGAKSASFLAYDEDASKDVFTLAAESGDPYIITDQPYLGYLQIDIEQYATIENSTLFLNLSKDPLTDEAGYFNSEEAFNTVLLFPELAAGTAQFLATYLHPGDYYINITADTNGDGFISTGDYTHPLQAVTIEAEGEHQITISNITVQN